MIKARQWQPDRPYNDLPRLPPTTELETKAVLTQSVAASSALAGLKKAAELIPNPAMLITNLVQARIAERQAASRYLKALGSIDVLCEQTFDKEKRFVHPKLMKLLTRDSNLFASYRDVRFIAS